MDSLGIDDRYKFETQIEQDEKSFSGVTYSYKTTVFYGKASCYGAINPKTKKVLLEENKLLEVKCFRRWRLPDDLFPAIFKSG